MLATSRKNQCQSQAASQAWLDSVQQVRKGDLHSKRYHFKHVE